MTRGRTLPVRAGTSWESEGATGGRLRIGVRVDRGGRPVSSVLILAADGILSSKEWVQGSGPGAEIIQHGLNLERYERVTLAGGGDLGGKERRGSVGLGWPGPGVADCQGTGWDQPPGGRTGVSAAGGGMVVAWTTATTLSR